MSLADTKERPVEKDRHLLPQPSIARPSTVPSRKQTYFKRIFLLVACVYAIHTISAPLRLWKSYKQPYQDAYCSAMTEAQRDLDPEEAEKLFLTIPNPESAIKASKLFASQPHLAGSDQDLEDAKAMLSIYQSALRIKAPQDLPIFPAGSKESRHATLSITDKGGIFHPRRPTAWIDVYYPVMNTPVSHSLEILDEEGEPEWAASLEEDGDELDNDAHKHKDAVLAWHGLSKDGEVEGQLVYANYGTKEDYDELVSKGADLTGKIVLARYGRNFRGLKIKGAEELGAAGVLIYSDPRDDGTITVENGHKPYPHGPARNPTSVQRGSVQYLSMYPGDPTTPGTPAYENATRTEGANIPKIPSLPISWANAERLLEEIDDSLFSTMSITGKSSKKTVRLVNRVDTKVTPIWNAMASIPGHIRNEVVVIGNHRDAWVLGAADPTSGTASMHEVIRGFGELLDNGWQPLRTIVFASWDAEEYGLIGSTEWGEDFSSWIPEHVVAYINVDVSVSGSKFSVQGSPSLAHLIRKAADEIDHPTIPGKSLWDATKDKGPYFEAGAAVDEDDIEAASETGVQPLGSGSDYTVFLQRLGVPSVSTGFTSTHFDPVYHYHSIYDSQRFQEVYADVGFHKHVTMSKFLGLTALRIIDSPILQVNTTDYALELDHYLDKVETIPAPDSKQLSGSFTHLRRSIRKLQRASRKLDEESKDALEKLEKLVSKLPGHGDSLDGCKLPTKTFKQLIKGWIKGHKHRQHSPHIRVENGALCLQAHESKHRRKHRDLDWDILAGYMHIRRCSSSGEDDRAALPSHVPHNGKSLKHHCGHHDPENFFPLPNPIEFIKAVKRLSRANQKIASFEAGFISDEGIKDREWYKHLGVAPGKWLGYGATTFPALTEALTIEKNVTMAEYETGRLIELIEELTETIEV